MINDTLTERVIAAAIKVHSALGEGCLESTYHACFAYQLTYQDVTLEAGYRIDFLVENRVIVELKAVEKLLPLHSGPPR